MLAALRMPKLESGRRALAAFFGLTQFPPLTLLRCAAG